MKPSMRHASYPVLVAAAVATVVWVNAGSLTPPPGPVTPTMKTLVEVEPRIAINSTNTPGDADSVFKITTPGSYYLVGNVNGQTSKRGIEIAASVVTVDLMGFELAGVPGSLDGITGPTFLGFDISVSNGSVVGWGGAGVNASGTANSVFKELRLSFNGGVGLSVGNNSKALNCTSTLNGDDGIRADISSTVDDCIAAFNDGDGIELSSGCKATDNTCADNGGAGIHATGDSNRIEHNHIADGNARGLDIDGADNYIADNTVRGNTDNYDFVAGNQLNLLLGEIPESIDWPASVKLAGSLTGVSGQSGIAINSGNVTIDLDGHALIGVPFSTDGIVVTGALKHNITIINGHIQSWGDYGIRAHQARNSRLENLLSSGNGASGIWGGYETIIRNCASNSNGLSGFFSQINAVITHCTAGNNGFDGFTIDQDTRISDCTAYNNEASGISVSSNNYVANNNCYNNDADGVGDGIIVKGSDNHIESNTVTGNTIGIDVNGTSNLIIRNSASGNTTAYSIAAGNTFGPTVTSATIATNSNPHANYDF